MKDMKSIPRQWGSAGKKTKVVSPTLHGNYGIPPKVRSTKNAKGISSPTEFGNKGMPVQKRPSKRHDPRMD